MIKATLSAGHNIELRSIVSGVGMDSVDTSELFIKKATDTQSALLTHHTNIGLNWIVGTTEISNDESWSAFFSEWVLNFSVSRGRSCSSLYRVNTIARIMLIYDIGNLGLALPENREHLLENSISEKPIDAIIIVSPLLDDNNGILSPLLLPSSVHRLSLAGSNNIVSSIIEITKNVVRAKTETD